MALVDTSKLIKVATYAKQLNVTPSYIYQQIDKGKLDLKMIEIDGTKFLIQK